GDTVYIGTADGIKLSWDRGATWAEITDSAGATTAQHVVGRVPDQYVQALAAGPDGSLWAAHLRGVARSSDGGRSWTDFPAPARVRALAPDTGGLVWVGTEQGLYRLDPARRAWLDKKGRPACGVAPGVKGCRVDMPPIELLARVAPGRVYAATRQGVYEQDGDALNLCDPVPAATAFLPLAPGWYTVGRPTGLVSCRIDQGLTLVGISYQQRPDTELDALRHTWFERPIALTEQPYIDQTYRYGSTMGGNFQQHQGVEFNNPDGTPVHAIGDGVVVFAGPAEQGANTVAIRHSRKFKDLYVYSVYYHNTTLLASVGRAAQARVFGLMKAEPQETPFSYAETYGEHNHPDPAYHEHFAVSDVELGDYTLAVVVDGKRLTRRIRVAAGRLSWVVFGSGAH